MLDNTNIGWKAESTRGVVAAGGAPAVSAGLRMLDDGGNAADAAAATIFALNVTDHGECSIGGEVPLLIYDAAHGEVKALSGAGRAPLSPSAIEWYMKHGIPPADIKMAPVPSVVDLCITTLQQYGTMSFSEIIAPTLELLDSGNEDWHPNLAHTLRRMAEEETAAAGDRITKLQAACNRFYGRGDGNTDIAEELEAFYREKGGFLTRQDLAAHRTTIEEPVSISYRGYTILKCGPWTQGPFLCQALRLLEGFDISGMGHLSADYIHVTIEAIKLAMADRDTYYGDPEFVDVPLAQLLSDRYTELRTPLIDMEQASQDCRPGDPYEMKPMVDGGMFRPGVGGTTTCVVADSWGNVVAATPSANVHHEKPAGGEAGVTFGNRLLSLNTTPGHPNCIQPGKRPRITLTPTIVLKGGKPIMAISVAGGDLQDQATLSLLLDVIDYGDRPEKAVVRPRFATAHHQDSFDPNPERGKTFIKAGSLTIGDEIDERIRDELAERGHEINALSTPIANPVMLYVDQANGTYYAAGDPKAHRHAGGLED